MSATPFEDLNRLLDTFALRLRDELGDQLVGVYLQGSFALGAGDRWSDVDFIVATKDPIADLAGLNAMHSALFDQSTSWAHHLEGSYLPVALLRTVDPARTAVPFLDNGARQLELDPHCNSAVVRWILSRHGITLYGPQAASLVDPVREEDLRREAADALEEYLEWGTSLTTMSAWAQPYLVLTLCRLLRTIGCGDVTTKEDAGKWAMTRFPAWTRLIERALKDRPHPWERVRQAGDPAAVHETHSFVRELAENHAAGR